MIKRTIRLSPLILSVLTLTLLYQNCAPGFAPLSSVRFSSETASGDPTKVPGNIINLNPYEASGNPSLPFATDLTPYLSPATLKNLQVPGTFLGNGRVIFDKDDMYPTQIARPTENLMLTGKSPKLQHVNAYYHIDEFVQKLLLDQALPTRAPLVHANAHCVNTSSEGNAYYDFGTNELCLGAATLNSATKAWSANDADVVVHEFGHSVNHSTASSDTLVSTPDLGALDEGLADVWAYLHNSNPYIARWYGSAIYTSLGYALTGFKGLRDLTTTPTYPDGLSGERHDDSTMISTIFFELAQRGVSRSTLHKLLNRLLGDLQLMDGFKDVVRYLKEESASLGIDANLINTAIQSRGLHRRDDLNQLSIDATTGVVVIDNHALPSYQANGNCNGKIDVGETAIVLVNLQNTGGSLGSVSATLTSSTTSGIAVQAGWDRGSYMRFKANAKFTDGLPSTDIDTRHLDILYAAFLVTATASGTYNFNLDLTGFNTIDSQIVKRQLPFSITVGTQATIAGTCTSPTEDSVWP